MLQIEELSTNLVTLVGREPNFDHSRTSGQVGVAFRFLANSLYGTGVVFQARSSMACARARREYI